MIMIICIFSEKFCVVLLRSIDKNFQMEIKVTERDDQSLK